MIVGLLGGGVIGAGWAARFLLNGDDVDLYDPDPDASARVARAVANARRAHRRLLRSPLPAPGRLRIAPSPEDACAGSGFVQESAPERESVKHDVLARASRAAGRDIIIASSTSGLRPTALASAVHRPQRFLVGHPFNPVYLLPLVEVVGCEHTSRRVVDATCELYRAVGMQPLVVRREVDGHIADRLLEALWREALWLVADETATTSEIDDAIRYGAGLRFASMGTFLTYRLAGGPGGMRHFVDQFGPALRWPWSRLVDVPDLTDGLVDRLVEQSDEQAAGHTLTELERLRDQCLVAVLAGLRSVDYGAGATLAAYDARLARRAPPATTTRRHQRVVLETIADADFGDEDENQARTAAILAAGVAALLDLIQSATQQPDRRGFVERERRMVFHRPVAVGAMLVVRAEIVTTSRGLQAWLRLAADQARVAEAEVHFRYWTGQARRSAPLPRTIARRIDTLTTTAAGDGVTRQGG